MTKQDFFESQSSRSEKLPGMENRETEQRRVLKLGDKFWNKLRAKVGSRIGNPRLVDIVFCSTKDSIQQTIHRINLVDPISNYEYVIVGNYDPEDGSIHFNIGPDDIPGDELARVLTHELVHMLQDDMGKFPEMGKKKKVNSSGVDVESPWEVEAYKIQKELFPDFLADCKIY